MQKEYRYDGCKQFVQRQDKDSRLAKFSFSEMEGAEEEPTEEPREVTLEVTNPIIAGWRNDCRGTEPSQLVTDDDLKKVLCGIAIKDGLNKGVESIKVNSRNYPQGISGFEKYAVEEGKTVIIQLPDSPFGFHSKRK